jgi:hypothetical protein
MFNIDINQSEELMNIVINSIQQRKNLRFKSCNNGKYLIILSLCDDSETDESRNVHNQLTATFRASKMNVVMIVNKMDPTDKPDKISITWGLSTCVYEVGKIVYADGFSPIHSLLSQGIHYFKSVFPAICFNLHFENSIITGLHHIWDHDGFVVQIVRYKNGKIDGEHIHFDGHIKLMILHRKNGIFHGRSTYYYRDGKISQIMDYDNGNCIRFSSFDEKGNETILK